MKKNKDSGNEISSENENKYPLERSYPKNEEPKIISEDQKIKLRRIRRISRFLDYIVLCISILALCIGVYAFWDTHKLMEVASVEEYAAYKPNSQDRLSFEELMKLNEDVIGWIDVYGTNIDYPIVQGESNQEYINKTVLGKFSTAGSIFLDTSNKRDFSDFQNILYGHHMAEGKMFGNVDLFKSKDFFDSHKYGVVHIAGKPSRGIEFFSFLKTVGNDEDILTTAKKLENKPNLIDHIYSVSEYTRELDFGDNENLLVFDTCDLSITNGRYILIGRLTDKVEENIYKQESGENQFAKLISNVYKLNLLMLLLVIWVILVSIYLIYEGINRKKKREESKTNAK